MEHGDVNREWFERSNYLAVLSAADEKALDRLIEKATKRGIRFSIFFEPDLGYEMTAVAFEPGKESKRLCSNLGLALKEPKKNGAEGARNWKTAIGSET